MSRNNEMYVKIRRNRDVITRKAKSVYEAIDARSQMR